MAEITYERNNTVLGAGRFFIDRHDADGNRTGKERYIGDTVGATLSATVERTTIFSGDGAVASKLKDKVTQVDRTLGITPRDASLDNLALFLIANAPETNQAAAVAGSVTFDFELPTDATARDYFKIDATDDDPAGAGGYSTGSGNTFTITTNEASTGNFAPPATGKFGDGAAKQKDLVGDFPSDLEIDLENGLVSVTAQGITKLGGISNRTSIKVKIVCSKLVKARLDRVRVTGESTQVTAAVRYVEEPDDALTKGRNIYIPQASISPAGEAALKSRDTEQQFPLTLSIEDPGGTLAQVYIDGEPAP